LPEWSILQRPAKSRTESGAENGFAGGCKATGTSEQICCIRYQNQLPQNRRQWNNDTKYMPDIVCRVMKTVSKL
jgi:hypothetical protein